MKINDIISSINVLVPFRGMVVINKNPVIVRITFINVLVPFRGMVVINKNWVITITLNKFSSPFGEWLLSTLTLGFFVSSV